MNPDLFEYAEAYARDTDPETSHEAADAVRGDLATRMEKRVLEALRQVKPAGLTGHELVEVTGIPYESCTPRIRPLVRKGLVVDTGEKRLGKSGRRLVVWKAT